MAWVPLAAAAIQAAGSASKTAPAGPSGSDSIFGTNLAFDNSGWNVSFGSSRIDSEATKKNDFGGASGPDYGSSMDPYIPYVVLALGAVIAWRMLKKS